MDHLEWVCFRLWMVAFAGHQVTLLLTASVSTSIIWFLVGRTSGYEAVFAFGVADESNSASP